MGKTGIERLRGLYVEWIGGDYLVALSDMIQETADQIEREHAEELAALEPRLMPEGMEWLRYNDGEKVLPTDEGIIGIEHSKTGNTVLITATDDEPRVVFAPGERVKRPEPEVLAADGLPLEVGDAVWFDDYEKADKDAMNSFVKWSEMKVIESNRPYSFYDIKVKNAVSGTTGYCRAADLTHTPPDTQERIDDDAAKECREYINGRCIEWPTGAALGDIEAIKCRDLLRRQRILDGVEK